MSEKKKNLIQKIAAHFSKTEEGKQIAAEVEALKLEGELPPLSPAAKEAKTKDGKVISYQGENLDKGIAVKITNPDGTAAATEGEFIMDDGTTVVVVGGMVSEIKAADPADTGMPADMAQKLSAHKKELEQSFETKFKTHTETQKAKIKVLEDSNSELRKTVATLVKFNQELLNIPVDEPSSLPEKKYEEMTALEKRRYQKEQEANNG